MQYTFARARTRPQAARPSAHAKVYMTNVFYTLISNWNYHKDENNFMVSYEQITIKVRRTQVSCMQETFARAHTWPKDQARATIGYLVYNYKHVPDL